MERLRTLGLIYIALGIIEWSWAFFCVAGGGILGLAGFADDRAGPLLWIGSGAYVLLAGVAAVLGLVHVAAGVRLRSGTGMILLMLAIGASLVSMVFALYCFPFSFGALVYTVVALTDAEARALLNGAG